MKTNQKLSDLSIGDLVSLYNYLNEELDALDNVISEKAECMKDDLRYEIVTTHKEIEKRRNNIFGN